MLQQNQNYSFTTIQWYKNICTLNINLSENGDLVEDKILSLITHKDHNCIDQVRGVFRFLVHF